MILKFLKYFSGVGGWWIVLIKLNMVYGGVDERMMDVGGWVGGRY